MKLRHLLRRGRIGVAAAMTASVLVPAAALTATATPAAADPTGAWAYFKLSDGSTATAVEPTLDLWANAVTPGFATQYLDMPGNAFAAYLPSKLVLATANYPNKSANPSDPTKAVYAGSPFPGTSCETADIGTGLTATGTVIRQITTSGAARLGLRYDSGLGTFVPANDYDPTTDAHSAFNAARDIHADTFWQNGFRGAGVDVALIDTGVSPVGVGGQDYTTYKSNGQLQSGLIVNANSPTGAGLGTVSGLDDPTKVIQGPDFSFESQSPNLTHLDTFGHGTAMAGIIHTVAPDARIVSVKVGDATGTADPTQVIAAIDWVREHKDQYGLHIKVLNLSYGVNSMNNYNADELSKAVDRAWRDGIVVVVAGGNIADQSLNLGLTSPSFNRRVIAVAAYDEWTDWTTIKDSQKPPFAVSKTSDNTRYPDFAVPGVSVTNFRAPGAQADSEVAQEMCQIANNGWTVRQNPTPIHTDPQGRTWLQGSGSSQATALTSGMVALTLGRAQQVQPLQPMRPDDIYQAFTGSATQLPNGSRGFYGNGALNMATVFARTPMTGSTRNYAAPDGGGSIESTRGGYHIYDESAQKPDLTGCQWAKDASGVATPPAIDGQPLCGEKDVFGHTFNTTSHAGLVEQDKTWSAEAGTVGGITGGVWNGTVWIGAPAVDTTGKVVGFTTAANGQKIWPSVSWAGAYPTLDGFPAGTPIPGAGMPVWDGSKWVTGNWAGSKWLDSNWSGSKWLDAGWSGSKWREGSWSGSKWRGAYWQGSKWLDNDWQGSKWVSNGWSDASWS